MSLDAQEKYRQQQETVTVGTILDKNIFFLCVSLGFLCFFISLLWFSMVYGCFLGFSMVVYGCWLFHGAFRYMTQPVGAPVWVSLQEELHFKELHAKQAGGGSEAASSSHQTNRKNTQPAFFFFFFSKVSCIYII